MVEVNDMTFVYDENASKAYLYKYNGEGNPVFPKTVDFKNGLVVSEYGIYQEAFTDNMTITELVIPDNVTSIGNKAFYFSGLSKISNITTLSIGSGVTSIGESAFNNLTKVETFYYNANIDTTYTNAKSQFYSVGNSNTILTIGKDVTSLPANIFNQASFKEVLFEEGSKCTTIGTYAFKNMTALTYIELPSTLTSISTEAFYGCTNLAEVYNNSTLTVTAGLSANGYVAYYASIVYKTGDARMSIGTDELGNTYLYDIESEKLILVKCNQTASTFTFKESYTFSDHEFTSIEIGSAVFANNSKINKFEFTKAVTKIGDNAFSFTSASTNGITLTGDLSGVKEIGNYAFRYRSKLTSFDFTNVETIGISAFEFCTGLTSIVIPNTTKKILTRAFNGCEDVTEVTIGTSVTTLASYAFSYMYKLEKLNFNANIDSFIFTSLDSGANPFLGAGKNSELTVTFGENVTKVPSYFAVGGYYAGMNITNVVFLGDITTIGLGAFYKCANLKSITLPETLSEINDSAFEGCSSLTSIVIPDSVTTLGRDAFEACTKLESVKLGSGVTAILNETFYQCYKLKSIAFGENITSIGQNAFYYCESLEEITLPDSLTTINTYAFYCCKALKSITIPANVSTLGTSTFRNCSSLESFTFAGTKITTIPTYTFAETGIKNLVIPSCITVINTYAFQKCTSLESITIGKQVESFSSAFDGCNSVTLINYNATNCQMGDFSESASTGCKVVIGDNVKSLPQKIFYTSTKSAFKINEMVIGSGLTNYPAYMLDNVVSDGIIVIKSTGNINVVYLARTSSNVFTGKVYSMANSITDEYGVLTSATIYTYSETTPATPGNYWHYDTEGNIVEEVIE